MSDPKRDKAISKVHSLDQLANHPNTPKPEAESARAMAAKLRAKYNIAEPRKEAPKNDRTNQWDAQRFEEARRRAQEWQARAERARKAAETAATEERRRIQREAWQKIKDAEFKPTADPFEDAIRRDGRTPQERNADMQDRLRGKTPPEPRCVQPETFFTSGGVPRQRNQYVMACEKCHGRLAPGEGAILNIGGTWKAWCCEMTPGPRRKQPWARD